MTINGTAPVIAAVPDASVPPLLACARCQHWINDRQALERLIAGLVVFGSGLGASAANSRLCRLHDRIVSPADVCSRFTARA